MRDTCPVANVLQLVHWDDLSEMSKRVVSKQHVKNLLRLRGFQVMGSQRLASKSHLKSLAVKVTPLPSIIHTPAATFRRMINEGTGSLH